MGGLGGWIGWASESWFQLRSWSQGCGIEFRVGLCTDHGACLGFSLSLSLSLSLLLSPVVLFLSFEVWGTTQTIFQSGFTILYSHWHCMRVLISPHPLSTYCWNKCLNCSHPSGYKSVFHYGFDLHLPNDNGVKHFLHKLISNLYIFFGKLSTQILWSFYFLID